MAEEGISSRGYFAPIHTQPYIHDLFGNLSDTLPVTESIAERTIALPFSSTLEEVQIERICNTLQSVL